MKMFKYYISYEDMYNYDYVPNALFPSFEESVFPVLALELPNFKLESGKYYYLYAFTADKELAKMFEDIHDMEKFIKITENVSVNTYERLVSNDDMCFIQLSSFKDKNGKEVSILTTLFENLIICDIEDYIEMELYRISSKFEYEQYTEKYIRALDYLLYCSYNKMDGVIKDFHLNFDVTEEGYVKNPVKWGLNLLSIYYNMFSHLLK